MLYDVWQKGRGNTPVEIEIEAETKEKACEIISQETGIAIEQLFATEAGTPPAYDKSRKG